MGSKPVIGITMGDPVGVGPELMVKALQDQSVWRVCTPLVLGDGAVIGRTLRRLDSSLRLNEVSGCEPRHLQEGMMNILTLSDLDPDRLGYGNPTEQTGEAMVGYVLKAVQLALTGEIAALVTGPINKLAMTLAGYSYPGHTELLAEKTHTRDYAMMLAGEKLRVVLVTIHHPLREVPEILTREKILTTLRVSHTFFHRYFGVPQARLAVASLNPHAGEGGRFGNEEKATIIPAVEEARKEGINAAGPFPADSLFFWAAQGRFDAVIAMYHDQGLIPLKLLHFDDAVNITLGLPIIRTSVDHGTAYDIAGTGQGNPRSLISAIKLASEFAVTALRKN